MTLRSIIIVAFLILAPVVGSAGVVTEGISWIGADGYTMTGQFQYSDTLANTGMIAGSQLTSLSIQGFLSGSPIGSWNLASGYAGFTFNFNFDTTALTFAQGGYSSSPTGQDWDVTTGGGTCPNPGFGFSSGSGGQGLCVNGSFVVASYQSVYDLQAVGVGSVPEPATVALVGIASLALLRRRTRAR